MVKGIDPGSGYFPYVGYRSPTHYVDETGKVMLIASGPTIMAYNAKTYQLIQRLAARDTVTAMTYWQTMVIVGQHSGRVTAFIAQSGDMVWTALLHKKPVTALLLHNDVVYSCSLDCKIQAIAPQLGAVLHRFTGHDDGVLGLDIGDDGLLTSWSEDGTLRTWNINNGESGRVLYLDQIVSCVARVEQRLFLAMEGGGVYEYDTNTGSELRNLSENAGVVGAGQCRVAWIIVNDDCTAMYTCDDVPAGTQAPVIRMWDLKTNTVKHSISIDGDACTFMALRQGLLFCALRVSGTRCYNAKTGKLVKLFPPQKLAAEHVTLWLQTSELVVGTMVSGRGGIQTYDVRSAKPHRAISAPLGSYWRVRYWKGRYYTLRRRGTSFSIIDARTGVELAIVETHVEIHTLDVDNGLVFVICHDQDTPWLVFHAATGELVQRVAAPVGWRSHYVQQAQAGQWQALMQSRSDAKVFAWFNASFNTQKELQWKETPLTVDAPGAGVWDVEAKQLVTLHCSKAGQPLVVQRWDTRGTKAVGEAVHIPTRDYRVGGLVGNTAVIHDGLIYVACLFPDNRVLAIDAKNRRRIVTFYPGATAPIYDFLIFQNEYLITASLDSIVRVYPLGIDEPIASIAENEGPVYTVEASGDYIVIGSNAVQRVNVRTLLSRGVYERHDEFAEKTFVDRMTKTYGPTLDLIFAVFLLFLDFIQMFTFAFADREAWGDNKIVDLAITVRLLGFDFAYFWVYVAAVGMAGVFLYAFVVQELVEWRRFVKPHLSSWKYIWILIGFYVRLVAQPLLVPILATLLEPLSCLASGTYSGSNPCWSAVHQVALAVGSALAVLVLPTAIRLARAGGRLESITLTWNPFDWSKDRFLPREQHGFSVLRPRYSIFIIIAKTALILIQSLLGDAGYPLLVACLVTAVGLALVIVSVGTQAYYGEVPNRLRIGLDFGVLYMYGVFLVAAVSDDKSTPAQMIPFWLAVSVLAFFGDIWLHLVRSPAYDLDTKRTEEHTQRSSVARRGPRTSIEL